MDNPITITLTDVGAMCALILSVAAVIGLIIQIVSHFRAPDKRQDERITALETAVQHINDRLEAGDKRFNLETEQIKELENKASNTNKIVLESLQVLIGHSIDGNNIDDLKGMKKKLDKFLLER